MAAVWRISIVCFLLLLAAPALAVADTIVVCPSVYREALGAWIKYREAQGHTIKVIGPGGDAAAIRNAIRNAAKQTEVKAVVLIGDTPSANKEPGGAAIEIPASYVSSRIIPRYGGEQQIATDNVYADLDDDEVPDVAVGRLSADSPEELSRLIKKIVDYESSGDVGLWRRRINLVAGVGGFGPLVDAMVENTTKMFLVAGIPGGFQTSMTQASWTSPYCPDPREFSDTTIGRLNEGCLFWVYLGHGQPRQLDMMRVPMGRYPILSVRDVPRVRCLRGPPIALFFSCYACGFDGVHDCLGEELLRRDGGPVAVIGGSQVTMPYGMGVIGTAMLNELFTNRRATLGEIFLHAKKSLAEDAPSGGSRKMLDALGGWFARNKDDLVAERRDHLHLFNLLGDPLLRLRYPQEAEVTAPAKAQPGDEISVSFKTPVAGQATVELVVRRDRLSFRPQRRIKYDDSDSALMQFQQVYRKANDPRLAGIEQTVAAGEYDVKLRVPDDAGGPCHLRVFVRGEKDFAIGAANVSIRKPPAVERKVGR